MRTIIRHREEILTGTLAAAPCIGRLAGIGPGGDILVEHDGAGPSAARLLSGINRKALLQPGQQGREVLLVFDKGDPEKPVIIGLLENPLEDILAMEVASEEPDTARDARIDGRRITIEAENEILLKCGKGSILIRRDGKIIIKGTELLSRASGPHRIKGGSVNIN